jgi:hypothetical protein
MTELQDGLSITLDEITSYDRTELPLNEDFVAKLINVEGKHIKEAPALVTTWELQEGPSKGLTVDKIYYVGIALSKKGNPYSRGLSAIKADAVAFGGESKLPKAFTNPVDLKALRLAYHKIFAGPKVLLRQTERFYKANDGEEKRIVETHIRPYAKVTTEAPVEEEIAY